MKQQREAVVIELARGGTRGDLLEAGLAACVSEAVMRYLADCGDHEPDNLHDVVLSQVERPLYEAVFEYADGNQSRCAAILGVSRGTVRKKLKQLGVI